MEASDLIKEIDPEYYICCWCLRLLHKSKLQFNNQLPVCVDYSDCHVNYRRMEEDDIKRVNQRNRS